MMIYKLIALTLTIIMLFAGYELVTKQAYQDGYDAHKLSMLGTPAVGNYADIRYIAGTYKRLYQECAGENASISPDLEKMILNLKLGEL